MSVTGPDMDEWAALWAEPVAPEERERDERLATLASRRARWWETINLGFGFAVAAAVLVALAVRPTPISLAIGSVACAILVWSIWNWYRLQASIARMIATNDRVDLLGRYIRSVEVERQRSWLGLVCTPPIILLFAMLTFSFQRGGSLSGFGPMLLDALATVPAGPAVIAALITIVIHQARSVSALGRELARLRALYGEYREEARLDRAALG